MSLLFWLAVAAYTAVGLVVDRMVAGHLAWSDKSSWRDVPLTSDWSWGFAVGTAAGVVWPMVVVLWTLNRGIAAFQRNPRLTFLAVGAEVRGLRRQAQREAEELRRKIAEIENDLGLSSVSD